MRKNIISLMIQIGLAWSVLGASGIPSTARADLAVIVNLDNGAMWSLDNIKEQIKDIFLGKVGKFPGGASASPVDQSESHSMKNEFYLKIADKDESAMNIFWSNLIFTGNGRPPKMVGGDGDVKRFVRENNGGIGYISGGAVDNTIKVIYRIK